MLLWTALISKAMQKSYAVARLEAEEAPPGQGKTGATCGYESPETTHFQ